MENGKGGSLVEGVSEKYTCNQKAPRESGQGERPKKGSGTTICSIGCGSQSKKKDADGDYDM